MRSKLTVFLFIAGVLFTSIGFLFGHLLDKTLPISELKEILPSITPSPTTQNSNQEKVSQKEEAIVKKVLDGDTIETISGERIRYIGMNTPEKGQPFSSEAKVRNQELVDGKKISLEFDLEAKDRYGRTLAYVFINNIFVNQRLIEEGLAVSKTIQPNVKYQKEFLKAQKSAREVCLGIWKELCKETN